MNTTAQIIQLRSVITKTHSLATGRTIDPTPLFKEARALAQAFHATADASANAKVYELAAVMAACFAEATIRTPENAEWNTSLKLCQLSRDRLRRLRPYDCEAMRMLWAIGTKSDELMTKGARVRTQQAPQPLRSRSFAEALAGRWGQPAEVKIRANAGVASTAWSALELEAQQWAGEHWTKTRAK